MLEDDQACSCLSASDLLLFGSEMKKLHQEPTRKPTVEFPIPKSMAAENPLFVSYAACLFIPPVRAMPLIISVVIKLLKMSFTIMIAWSKFLPKRI